MHAMCYKSLSPVKKTQQEAIDFCMNNESALIAVPSSDEDYQFVEDLTGKEPIP